MIPPESPPQIESKIVFGTGCENCIKLQAENKRLKEEIKKAIKFIDETPRYHDARDTVIDAIKYNLTQALQEKDV